MEISGLVPFLGNREFLFHGRPFQSILVFFQSDFGDVLLRQGGRDHDGDERW